MKRTVITTIVGILVLGVLLFFTLKDSVFSKFAKDLSFQKTKQKSETDSIHSQYDKKPTHFWRGETMSVEGVCEKWGETPFDLSKFKESGSNEFIRAKMACSLLKNQNKYYGIERHKIREIFGAYSGHYFKDVIPAYLIESAKTKDQDTWQIVFLSDKNYKIARIIVHKNCCDR
ncbi:MAG: hypothetical protein OXK80_06375 [Bdellovibrionales bacterium]|nr:hypothetical protein [Bdellovibrionales bacterium]